jgi:hypothetical protein
MTHAEIMKWMREAGAGRGALMPKTYDGIVEVFVRVVEQAVAAEREACLRECNFGRSSADIENAIRARREK